MVYLPSLRCVGIVLYTMLVGLLDNDYNRLVNVCGQNVNSDH